jgi:hypothetical protein
MENKLDLLYIVSYCKNVREKKGGIHLLTVSHSSHIIEFSVVIQSFHRQNKVSVIYYGDSRKFRMKWGFSSSYLPSLNNS